MDLRDVTLSSLDVLLEKLSPVFFQNLKHSIQLFSLVIYYGLQSAWRLQSVCCLCSCNSRQAEKRGGLYNTSAYLSYIWLCGSHVVQIFVRTLSSIVFITMVKLWLLYFNLEWLFLAQIIFAICFSLSSHTDCASPICYVKTYCSTNMSSAGKVIFLVGDNLAYKCGNFGWTLMLFLLWEWWEWVA